jgi:hypothetical protein
VFLVGCGSSKSTNGGSGTLTPGLYQGTGTGNGGGGQVGILITSSNQVYAIYSQSTSSITPIGGWLTATLSSSSSSASGTVTDFQNPGTNVVSGTLSVSESGNTLTGTLTEGSSNVSVSATAVSGYTFNTAAQISTLSGNPWAVSFLDGSTATLSVSSTGALSGTANGGCVMTGTLSPDSSNDNFFDLTLTFGGSPCALGTDTVTGLAVVSTQNGTAVLSAAGANSGNTAGTAFIGSPAASGSTLRK